jgi:hypothetical protein
MLFDAAAFEVNVNDFSKRNDPDAFERFLLDEIIRLNDGAFMTAGGESPAGKDEEALIADEAAFQANLNQGYILCYTELANLYRGEGLWPQCFDVYESLSELIEKEGLSNTQIGLSAYLNEAYARIDAGQSDRALALLEKAQNVPCDDPVALSRIYDAQAALCASSGDLNGAKEASMKSVECARDGAGDSVEYATMVMNHAAMLARMGDNTDAATAVDVLLEREDVPSSLRWQALNFRAKIGYQAGDYLAAAESLSTLISEAKGFGALAEQLPSLCLNCSEMYRLAGLTDKAEEYRELSAGSNS